jgi:hypothetical protein
MLQVQRVLDIDGFDRGVERDDLADAQPAALKRGERLSLDASAMNVGHVVAVLRTDQLQIFVDPVRAGIDLPTSRCGDEYSLT